MLCASRSLEHGRQRVKGRTTGQEAKVVAKVLSRAVAKLWSFIIKMGGREWA